MLQNSPEQSVTLILEGTYPFVRGGVSSWVHDLITGLPEISFDLIHLGAEPAEKQHRHYVLPANVRALQCHTLMDLHVVAPPASRDGNAQSFVDASALHDWFRNPVGQPPKEWLNSMLPDIAACNHAAALDFFHSRHAWEQICASYERYCPESPFNSYFWTVRNTHAPLLKLAAIAGSIKPGSVIHAVSTGYAGLLGAMLQQKSQRRFLLTEHGIYTKERSIELQAMLLPQAGRSANSAGNCPLGHTDALWLRLFEGIGKMAYAAADPVISLYEQNRQRQIRDGATPQTTQVIPNGVDITRYAPLRKQRPQAAPRVLGLVGRIVPIKDIKTFIRAMFIIVAQAPGTEGWIIGPEDEDRAYVDDCRELVISLGLESNVRFLGFRRIDEVLPQLGLLVLSSISEAFPLVIGESFASGLPVLATDVGACRGLLEGMDEEDRALGTAGAIVPIADAGAMASAALSLLDDGERWHAAQRAGIARVEKYYSQSRVIDRYRALYQSAGGV